MTEKCAVCGKTTVGATRCLRVVRQQPIDTLRQLTMDEVMLGLPVCDAHCRSCPYFDCRISLTYCRYREITSHKMTFEDIKKPH